MNETTKPIEKESLFKRLKRWLSGEVIVRNVGYSTGIKQQLFIVGVSMKHDDDATNTAFKLSFSIGGRSLNEKQAKEIAEILYPECYDIKVESVTIDGVTMTKEEAKKLQPEPDPFNGRFNLQNITEDIWIPIRDSPNKGKFDLVNMVEDIYPETFDKI